MFQQIVVPLDESLEAERALGYAEQLARLTDARLSLIRAVAPLGPPEAPGVATLNNSARERAERYIRQRVEALQNAGVGEADGEVCFDEPVEAILRCAEDRSADLIVMTTHGRGRETRRFAFGSVAMKVLASATCPVFLIRADES